MVHKEQLTTPKMSPSSAIQIRSWTDSLLLLYDGAGSLTHYSNTNVIGIGKVFPNPADSDTYFVHVIRRLF